MYLFEWMLWDAKSATTYEQLKDDTAREARKTGKPITRMADVRESMSKEVIDNDSIYAFGDKFIDVRTPNDEKRGLITLACAGSGGILLWMLFGALVVVLGEFIAGHKASGEKLEVADYLLGPIFVSIPVVALSIFVKYVVPYMRLELFTARRIIVRFNRVTRRVYLLRPKNCGGVVSLDWEQTGVAVDKKMRGLDGMGGFLYMGWVGENVGTDAKGNVVQYDVSMVGKTTRNAEELLGFWEYIRRYMEDGPQAVPPPKKLISKFPWPWNSFKAAWGLDTSFFGNSRLWIFVLLRVMVLPAVILQGIGHWVSLLLCYEPKFPKEIEQAGRPGP